MQLRSRVDLDRLGSQDPSPRVANITDAYQRRSEIERAVNAVAIDTAAYATRLRLNIKHRRRGSQSIIPSNGKQQTAVHLVARH